MSLLSENSEFKKSTPSPTTGHVNHMGGESYYPNDPKLKLSLILLSGFLGEPTYYNPCSLANLNNGDTLDKKYSEDIEQFIIHPDNRSRMTQFYEAAYQSLDSDFQGTLQLAHKARHRYLMRKSPMALLAIAAGHPKRVSFNKENPGVFRNIIVETSILPGDMITIIDIWKQFHGSKSKLPSFVKRAFTERVTSASSYQVAKYPKACRDIVRISHPSPTPQISELMTNGTIEVDEKDTKWETLKSRGKSWLEIMEIMNWRLPHMAALRNLRGFANQVRNEEYIEKYCAMLEAGVENGKQFPFQYISAYDAVKTASEKKNVTSKSYKKEVKYHPKPLRKRDVKIIMESLERCIQKSISNHPKLEGDVVILSDNSGSAWGTFTSKYGTKTVADIGNLSALITALSCTGRAMIGLFGDKLLEFEVDKTKPLLQQYDELRELVGNKGNNVGLSTENGIWLFFKRAMFNPEKYRFDHFFCYSDMQAGHGKLYGLEDEIEAKWLAKSIFYSNRQPFINVPKLLNDYRERINRKMSCFMIQTAGYNDSIVPESVYRGAIMAGWTGNEVVYADELLKLWDEIEN